MSPLRRWLVHRPHDLSEGVDPARAPEGLRRRVLGRVRSAEDLHESSSPQKRSVRIRRRALLAAASALAAIAAVTGVVALTGSSRDRDEVRITAGVADARASVKRVGAGAELQVSGMPQPPVGEVYELWLERGAGPPQATNALFSVTSAGSASVDVPGSLRGVRGLMVTSEPLGGSASPTGPTLLRVILARQR
jgi:hypothetical protein